MAETVGATASTLGRQLAQRFRDLRIERGMTQGELAAVLGVNQPAIAQVERAAAGREQANFRLATLEQFAWALECDLVVELRPRGGG